MSKKKDVILCSIDIETGGPFVTRNPLVSIGYVFGNTNGNVIEKGRISFKFDISKFDNDTYNDFWKKRLDLLKKFENEAVEPSKGIKMFINKLDEYDKIYNLRIISDNIQFETRFINYYIELYTDRKPIDYDYEGQYRSLYDIDSIHRGIERLSYSEFMSDSFLSKKYKIKIDVEYDHSPDNDAHYNYLFHIGMLKK